MEVLKPSDKEFEDLCELVYSKSGLRFNSKRRDFIENRLASRLELLGCSTYAEYLDYLNRDHSEAELKLLLDLLTTNETYFFRDAAQLKTFETVIQSMIAAGETQTNRLIRIWSAGCSIGCEPYSLAMILVELMKNAPGFSFEILGTDISLSALDVASRGLYLEREVREVPPHMLDRYFTFDGTYYSLSREVRSLVKFRYLNLMDKRGMSLQGGYDVIFCRNVLMYFDETSRREVLSRLYDSLRPGGYLFLGRTEAANQVSRIFKLVRIEDDFVYVK
ncbi:MAG: protein-glutamate O-methyltransferase CheR [Zestosphaera sp.]